MIALIPYVRETFRRHLSEKQAVMLVEFDKLKRVGRFSSVLVALLMEAVYRITKNTRMKSTQNSSLLWGIV